MRSFPFGVLAALALTAATPALAQDPAPADQVYVDVEGAAVQVAAALAAEACGVDEAEALEMAAAKAEESGLGPMDAEAPTGEETVATGQGEADPSTAEPGAEMLPLAICQVDLETAASLGLPQANEIVTD